jgi:hypothetical protein
MNQDLVVITETLPEMPKAPSPMVVNQDAFIALFSLLEALSYEVMSGDVWWLANHSAKKIATEKYGISEDTYDEVMEKFDAARRAKGKSNPLSSMF